MLLKKIIHKIKNKFIWLNNFIDKLGLAWNFLLAISFMSLIIIFLVINIINVYQQGKKNFDQIQLEKLRLEELQAEGENLSEELEYKESKHYIEVYAHENLSLGKNDERLYEIDREEEKIYELEQDTTDPIMLDNYKYWWQTIFLW